MTEKEAIRHAREYIKYLNYSGWEKDFDAINKLIIMAEENQQYKAIGTVEEFKELKYPDLLRCEDGSYAHVGDVVFVRIYSHNECKGVRGELIEIDFCEPDHALYFTIEAGEHVYTYVEDNRHQFEIEMVTRNVNVLQSEKDTGYEDEKGTDFEK